MKGMGRLIPRIFCFYFEKIVGIYWERFSLISETNLQKKVRRQEESLNLRVAIMQSRRPVVEEDLVQ